MHRHDIVGTYFMTFRSIALAALLASSSLAMAQVSPEQAGREAVLDASVSASEQMG